jgi:hypothetical protein
VNTRENQMGSAAEHLDAQVPAEWNDLNKRVIGLSRLPLSFATAASRLSAVCAECLSLPC